MGLKTRGYLVVLFFGVFFLAFYAVNASTLQKAKYEIDLNTKQQLQDNNIEIRKPEYRLNYSYSNFLIGLEEWKDGDFSIEDTYGFEHEKDIQSLNNNRINKNTISEIREILVESTLQSKSLLNAYLGYHEVIKPTAHFIRNRPIRDSDFEEIHLKGRYGQTIKAVCGFNPSREGLIILLPGSGGDIYAMFGMKNKDYSNNSAKYYYDNLRQSVCAIETYRRAGIALKRYGLSGIGVDITQVIDFITWFKAEYSNEIYPLLVGGVSRGGHLAEYVGLLDERVNGVISVGASARYDYPYSIYSEISLEGTDISLQDPANIGFHFMFKGYEIYKALASRQQALLISIGTHDAGYKYSETHDSHDKFSIISKVKNLYSSLGRSNCLEINLFSGGHAMEPRGEVHKIENLVHRCIR